MSRSFSLHVGRARAAWWGFLVVLALASLLFVASFAGTFLLGLFFYYAVRPLHRRLRRLIRRRSVSASLTLMLVVLPIISLVAYVGLVAVRELLAVAGPRLTEMMLTRLPGDPRTLSDSLDSMVAYLLHVENFSQVQTFLITGFDSVTTVATGLLHLTLALALTFFLLRDAPRLVEWFHDDVAEEGGVTDAYLTAVDADLEAVYFGHVLTVFLVALASLLVYHGFNLVAPEAVRVPFPTLLALLTGLATFVPLVVGKLVYLPTVAYLVWEASRAGVLSDLWPWVVGFLLVAFLVLDLLPQTFVRPYVSGRSLHTGLVLFGYVLGAALFGWYGLFLGPLLVVFVVQAANVVLPELLHGERLTPATYLSLGSEPWERQSGSPEERRGDAGAEGGDEVAEGDDAGEGDDGGDGGVGTDGRRDDGVDGSHG